MAHRLDEVAAHEAGHAVVLMATGVPVTRFTGIIGKHSDSYLDNPFESFAIEFDPNLFQVTLEPRLQYLCLVGGFAGEATHQAYIEPKGANDDLQRLKNVGLTNDQIQNLTGLAMEILVENLHLWKQIYSTFLFHVRKGPNAYVPGEILNRRFTEVGKRFADIKRLDAILQP